MSGLSEEERDNIREAIAQLNAGQVDEEDWGNLLYMMNLLYGIKLPDYDTIDRRINLRRDNARRRMEQGLL